MNGWYGVRFKKSFESDENWYKINRFGAQRLIIWSILLIGIGIFTLLIPAEQIWVILTLAHAPLILLIPAIQSWLYTRKL